MGDKVKKNQVEGEKLETREKPASSPFVACRYVLEEETNLGSLIGECFWVLYQLNHLVFYFGPLGLPITSYPFILT